MAIITNAGGGGGLDTDELTATAGDILKGKTAGVKGSDEPVAGTLELTGDAADSTVLSGKTYYNTDAKTKRTGTMANQGAKTAALNCGGSYTIPAGYHNGAGKVTANSLASQTGGATAEDKYVYTGKTYWKDGVKRTGSMTVSSVVSFSVAAYSATQFTCTWKWPSKGPYSGVIIRGKLGGYPTNAWDGQLAYQGTGSNAALGATSSVVISGAQEGSGGTTYYFRIWVYCTCSAGDVYSGYLQTTAATRGRGQQIFTSSGTFTVPANTSFIDVFCVGGGGGGNTGNSNVNAHSGGGGGGGGYTATKKSVAVSSGQQYVVTVGNGDPGSNKDSSALSNSLSYSYSQLNRGGTSSFGNLVIAKGGFRGNCGATSSTYGFGEGGSGGSGGGDECGISKPGISSSWHQGGQDGSNFRYYDGEEYWSKTHYTIAEIEALSTDRKKVQSALDGYGQGTTTRAFGENNGTLYSSGGGGGATWYRAPSEDQKGVGGYGGYGAGNGGDGSSSSSDGTSGAANTGSGGGGGGSRQSRFVTSGGSGGSGIVIVRWGY